MARTRARVPDRERVLRPARRLCPACGGAMRIRYENRRTLVTLTGTERLRLKIRRCEAEGCARRHKPYRPEAEGALALPQHEFGLDVVAQVGSLAPPRAPLGAGDPRHPVRTRRPHRRAQRHQPARPPRRGAGDPAGRRGPPAPSAFRAGSGRPRARWPAAGCRPRGAVGAARLPVGHGSSGAQPVVGHGRGSGCLAAGGGRGRRPCRSSASSATLSARSARRWPRCCRACPTSSATSTSFVKPRCLSSRPTGTPRRS